MISDPGGGAPRPRRCRPDVWTPAIVAGLGAVALAIAGCVRSPPVVPAPTAPAGWVAPSLPGPVVDGWVESWGDADLTAAVRLALDGHPDLAQAAARVRAAEALAEAAGGARWPRIGAAVQGSRNREGAPDVLGNQRSIVDRGTVGANIAWEVDLWGRASAQTRAAATEAAALADERDALVLALAGRVARAWIECAAAGERVILARRAADDLEVVVRLARHAVTSGDLQASELLAERSGELLSARDRVDAFADERRLLELRVATLVGRPQTAIPIAGQLIADPAAMPSGLPVELLTRRPDLRAAEARVIGGDERLTAARAAMYPKLTLSADAGRASIDVRNVAKGVFTLWSLGAGIVQPIFEGGRLRAEARAAAAERDALAYGFASVVVTAIGEAEEALERDARLAARIPAQDRTLALGRRLAGSVADRFANGQGSSIAVAEARRQVSELALTRLEVRLQRALARIDLHLALGTPPLSGAPSLGGAPAPGGEPPRSAPPARDEAAAPAKTERQAPSSPDPAPSTRSDPVPNPTPTSPRPASPPPTSPQPETQP